MSVPPAVAPLSLEILGLRVRIDCADPAAAELLLAHCGAMLSADPAVNADLGYRIRRDDSTPGFILTRTGGPTVECADLGELSFALEKDLIVELQLRRRDLLFLHAAAIEWHGFVVLLTAASRSGKSTTAWALLHHEFQYLSDELAPIDLATMTVLPFPHALCLKHAPAAPYALPGGAVGHGERIHVPTDALPSATITAALEFAGGAVGKLGVSFDAHTPYLFNLHLYGSRGTPRNNRLYAQPKRARACTRRRSIHLRIHGRGSTPWSGLPKRYPASRLPQPDLRRPAR